jgi:DNA processing protein
MVAKRILEEGGAIISEYPLKTEPLPYNFPYRNRIISGLSDKIFLIQASKKSGSLITIEYAIEQGKEVYVYKGRNLQTKDFEGNKILIENIGKII